MKTKLFAFIALMLLPLGAWAEDVEINGIIYSLDKDEKTASVIADEYSGDIVIPELIKYNGNTYSVTSIEDYAFEECSELTSITIPNSVTSIGYFAFYYCEGLEDIYALRMDPREYNADDCFYDVPISTCILHVPAGCKEIYASTYPWSEFVNIVEDAPTVIAAPSMDGEKGSMSNGQRSMIYDLLGRRAKQPARGLYIQEDGRKFIR